MIEVGSFAVGFLYLRVLQRKVLIEAFGQRDVDAGKLVKRGGRAVRVAGLGVRERIVCKRPKFVEGGRGLVRDGPFAVVGDPSWVVIGPRGTERLLQLTCLRGGLFDLLRVVLREQARQQNVKPQRACLSRRKVF